jgi:hypothetical protein
MRTGDHPTMSILRARVIHARHPLNLQSGACGIQRCRIAQTVPIVHFKSTGTKLRTRSR